MGETRKVELDLLVEEDTEHTEAEVTLHLRDREFVSRGTARRNPADPNVPVIGEELAVARALNELSHRLVEEATRAIESFEGGPVDVDV